LIVCQSNKGNIFGAFVDDVLRQYLKGYIGSSDSFVFTLKPTPEAFYDKGANERFLLGEEGYFQIGGEG
jgi:hypothetical protein